MQEFEIRFARFMVNNDMNARRRMWRKLSKLLVNGVPILQAMKSIYDRRVASGSSKDPLTIALNIWMESIRNGHRLGAAVDGWVPRDERMLISAGEQSGQLDKALQNASEIMISKAKIKKAVIGGLAYPIIMAFLALAFLVMFSFKVIPEFSRVVPYERWQGVAKFIIDLATFAREWLPLIVGIFVAIIISFFLSLPRWSDGMRIKVDRYAPYSIYRMLQGGTWMISLAALVEAGVRIENAVIDLSEGSSNWLKVRSDACLRGMRSGQNIGDALARSGYEFPDREIIDDLGVYAKLSGIDQALTIVGREWVEDGVEKIQGMMKVIFGISVLTVGLFIAFMVGGLISMELQMATIVQHSYR